MTVLRTAGSSASMRELVSSKITTETGSPPKSKCSIFCSTPLSKMWKSRSVRSSTNSPEASRTVTGAFTNIFDNGVEQKIRSEEHTSELQSRENLVCRLLLEKKK